MKRQEALRWWLLLPSYVTLGFGPYLHQRWCRNSGSFMQEKPSGIFAIHVGFYHGAFFPNVGIRAARKAFRLRSDDRGD